MCCLYVYLGPAGRSAQNIQDMPRGRAGLPPPGRRLVFCIYLVYICIYLVYICIFLYIFVYNFVPSVLPVPNRHKGDTINVPDPYRIVTRSTIKQACYVMFLIMFFFFMVWMLVATSPAAQLSKRSAAGNAHPCNGPCIVPSCTHHFGQGGRVKVRRY